MFFSAPLKQKAHTVAKHSFVLVLFLFVASGVSAQGLFKPVKYCDSTLLVLYSKKAPTYIMGSNIISYGMLVRRLNSVRASAYEYKEARKAKKTSKLFLYSSSISFLAFPVVYTLRHNQPIRGLIALPILGLVSFGIDFSLIKKSNRHFYNSIEFYNREMYRRTQ